MRVQFCAFQSTRRNGSSGRHQRSLRILSLTTAVATAALFLTSSGCSSPRPRPGPAPTQAPDYRVGPPDKLSILILPEPAIERSATVRPDGMISIDLIGDIMAEGKTPTEIAAEIANQISRYKRDPNVTVAVEDSLSNTITVLGEVRAPQSFPVRRDMRVSEAIGRAGGITQFASRRNMKVVRAMGPETIVLEIDFGAIERGDLTSNFEVRGGDLIVAPPNILAKIGYALQTLLFPLQPVITGAGSLTTFGVF